ncbi:MAG: hypothetical protein HY559_01750 [Gammaproteobacteria bacterium]|nr:hypothetical protein [Gammaproteobacteria bacterium]
MLLLVVDDKETAKKAVIQAIQKANEKEQDGSSLHYELTEPTYIFMDGGAHENTIKISGLTARIEWLVISAFKTSIKRRTAGGILAIYTQDGPGSLPDKH